MNPIAIPMIIAAAGITGPFGVKFYAESRADKWAISSRISVVHSVRVGWFKTFYFDDHAERLAIWQPFKSPIIIPYAQIAGYEVRPVSKNTAKCAINTYDKSRPLIVVDVGSSAGQSIGARMIAHVPQLERIA